MANADAAMTGALGRLLVTVEAYPNLKADAQFTGLRDELSGTENRIAVARTDYNNAVKTYKTTITQFPTVLPATATGAKPTPYYEATNANANTAPTVDFTKTTPPSTKPPLD